jgi:hypothetical protein
VVNTGIHAGRAKGEGSSTKGSGLENHQKT